MGQKVNPVGLRVGIIRDWESKWYANPKEFAPLLYEDHQIRETIKSLEVYREPIFVEKKKDDEVVNDSKTGKPIMVKKKILVNPKDKITLASAGIASIQIDRPAINKIRVFINAAKPGQIIGKNGAGIEHVKKAVEKVVRKRLGDKAKLDIFVNVLEIKNSNTNAQIVAEKIQKDIEKRVSFKRAMKQAVKSAMNPKTGGAKGIKVRTSGRLGGAEMARVEKENAGKVPLHTLRADIDYGFAEAWTQYGHIGVKVWIYKGDIPTGTRRSVEVADRKPKKAGKKPQKRNFKPGNKPNNKRFNNQNKGDKA